MRRQYGDFTIAIVMAHELGHAVQARTKVVAKTVTKEQQADCYAGAWVASVWNGYSKNFKVGLAELDKAVAETVDAVANRFSWRNRRLRQDHREVITAVHRG